MHTANLNAFRFNSVLLPPTLVSLKRRLAEDTDQFLAALSSTNSSTPSSTAAAVSGQVNQRGVSNLPAWMLQEGGSTTLAQPGRDGARSPSPPLSSGVKVPPPKRSEPEALTQSHSTALGAPSSDRSSDHIGERGISNLPAWMTQDASSAAKENEGASSAVMTSLPPPPPLSEIKIPVPKTAAEAAVSFPSLSRAAAAGEKRERVDDGGGGSVVGNAKRPRESSAALMMQEVAMLLLDSEVEAACEPQLLETLTSNIVKSGDGLRSVSRFCVFFTCVFFVRVCDDTLTRQTTSFVLTYMQAISAVLQVAPHPNASPFHTATHHSCFGHICIF
jgi:hypothetical protein